MRQRNKSPEKNGGGRVREKPGDKPSKLTRATGKSQRTQGPMGIPAGTMSAGGIMGRKHTGELKTS